MPRAKTTTREIYDYVYYMNQDILHYIRSQLVARMLLRCILQHRPRVCVLAVEMPDAKQFYFLTSPEYRKTEALLARPVSRASVVIGVDEANMKTLQMDGEVRIVPEADRASFDAVYFGRFPEKLGKFANDLAFTFTPTWWRYTDWTTAEGKKVISSTD